MQCKRLRKEKILNIFILVHFIMSSFWLTIQV